MRRQSIFFTEATWNFRIPFGRAHNRTNSILSFKRLARLRSLPVGYPLHVLRNFRLRLADVPHHPLEDGDL